MNPLLERLRPYPFERLRALLADCEAPAHLEPIDLSIGEPKHATPRLLLDALAAALPTLSSYPKTAGSDALRISIGHWLSRRYRLADLDPLSQVLPVTGSREALFAFAQAMLDARGAERVVMPNPGYQIYEGATLLAGAEPVYLSVTADSALRMPFERLGPEQWKRVRLVYTCSPGNPTGAVMPLSDWRYLFEQADRYGFVIAADECYSEIYPDPRRPPLGALQAAAELGRIGFAGLVVFGSLSKRSNAPGLRSGYVAGDARLLAAFLRYRTYHGCAMSPAVQAASMAAWNDEAHVEENRRRYAAKFGEVTAVIGSVLPTAIPDGGFYLWARTPGDDRQYARRLYAQCNVTVLPGSFLGREVDGVNPGAGFVRIALVAPEAQVREAARRIALLGRDGPQRAPDGADQPLPSAVSTVSTSAK
ncbi:MAG TPA: succinyldiaminopimelate transaminase [Burkholderiaceae bacterium]|nr:succinyldiaminopimelate transaminase [Burkholderiaceae bacterium]